MDFRHLDTDLDRIANRESAALHLRRQMQRFGMALMFAAAVVLVTANMGLVGSGAGLAAAVMVGAFLALSIGANDSANALGPAVGAGAISMPAGLALVALAEIAGALTAGGPVSETLASGILPPRVLAGDGGGTVMLAAMIAAAGFIALATWAGAPVSTTHAIVGGIAGAGVARFGAGAPDWSQVSWIAAGWVASPLIAGLVGAAILALLRRLIQQAPDPVAAARRWLPRVAGASTAVLGIHALALTGAKAAAVGLVLPATVATWALARRSIARRLAGPASGRKVTEQLFGPPLVAAAVLIGFGHGSNDVGNVVAPLSIALRQGISAPTAPGWLAVGGAGFALGAVLFGRRLVNMVGSKITRLNPVRGLCVALATALVLLGATAMGMPVSSTHVAVGAVFGVGFYREWDERRLRHDRAPLPPEESRRRRLVRRTVVARTLAAWVVTVPITAALAAAVATAIG